jgi:hypothetical protein
MVSDASFYGQSFSRKSCESFRVVGCGRRPNSHVEPSQNGWAIPAWVGGLVGGQRLRHSRAGRTNSAGAPGGDRDSGVMIRGARPQTFHGTFIL